MAFFIPMTGRKWWLKRLTGELAYAELTVKLYTNDATIHTYMELADLTECTATDYVGYDLTGATWSIGEWAEWDNGSGAVMFYVHSAATVYGAYLVSNGELIAVEPWSSPAVFTDDDDAENGKGQITDVVVTFEQE